MLRRAMDKHWTDPVHAGVPRAPQPGVAALDGVAGAHSIVGAIQQTGPAVAAIGALARNSATTRHGLLRELAAAADDPRDAVLGIAATHAVAAIPGPEADHLLAGFLARRDHLAPHVAWRAGTRRASGVLLEPLTRLTAQGGLAGMLAQHSLERWARQDPWLIAAAVRAMLLETSSPTGRRHLVETLGLVQDAMVVADLRRVVGDLDEPDIVRLAALLAIQDRQGGHAPSPSRSPGAQLRRGTGRTGLRIAQVHLGAMLDAQLSMAGAGATGGIATLLVKLGDALVAADGVGDVLTIGRGSADSPPAAANHSIRNLPLPQEAGTAFSHPWPARVAAERELRRVLLEGGRPDVIHLRMADVGTLAAANVADELGIPTVFTLAPDPHGLINAREQAGELDRRGFGSSDLHEQLWYRVALVERLTNRAAHVALFPRQGLVDELRELTGFDIRYAPRRFTVVPEGIDTASIRRATARPPDRLDHPTGAAASELVEAIARRPAHRHGLPIVLSVGRLSEVKGMARLVEAFTSDATLREHATLVIVGGNLDRPTPEEAAELERIDAQLAASPAAADAVVLLGHRPNDQIGHLLAMARHGHPGLIAGDGAYACASRKEEFGLAIVEAMAAGLPVVAPRAGGPATYVEHGRTGFLVDTIDLIALAEGISGALSISAVAGRAEHAVARIARDYDVSAMATSLAGIYQRVSLDAAAPLAS
jgi:glycosyltransferase involved in cell wall biosynthesis